ncbi:MAG: OmpA family protein [Blastocatellia bacterium]|nr:OmpA family protein [Blastocatellia bacterium]
MCTKKVAGQRDNRYAAGKLTRAGAEVYVSVFIGSQATQLDIIEVKPIEGGLFSVDADALGADIESEGHAAVYAILFDTGKAIIKPESSAAIAEIAKLLKDRPRLNLYVVGHTDSTGGFEMNMKLSLDRAQAVVQSLVSEHGIAASRLKSHGVGPLAPVRSNATEEGKSKNRRVDLVAQ